MRIGLVSLCVALAASLACEARAYTPPAGSPLARSEHPRLWITRDNLPDLRAKLAGDFKSEYQVFVSELDQRIEDPKNWSQWANDVLNYAFVYQVGAVPGISYKNPIAAYGERAKLMLLAAAADRALDDARNVGLAYDWVFNIMSPGERSTVVGFMKQIIDGTAGSGGNPYNGNDVLRRSAHILAGLAFWGDGVDNAAADAMVGKYATLIEGPNGVLGAGSFYAGREGGWSMGMSYSFNSATGVATPRVMEAWRTANGYTREQVFGAADANVIRYYPKWFAYNVLSPTIRCSNCPGGYQFPMYRTHAMDSALTSSGLGWDLVATLSAMRLYKTIDPEIASLTQWLLDQRTYNLGTTGYAAQAFGVFSQFIAGEKGIAPRSPADLNLPLTKLFPNAGWAVMRTGWGTPTDTVVTFMASPWSRAAGSYSNFNQGSFTIDRRGPLAINSGSGIHHSYAYETWASNTIVFPDPNEAPIRSFWDKGGQRVNYPQLFGTPQLVPGAPFDLGGLRRFASGESYDYAFADVTRAYNGPSSNDGNNSQKVASFTRQLAYFHPDAPGAPDHVVVFDRAVTTDVRFEKRWILHPSSTSAGEISINGTAATARPGKTDYSGADLIAATNTSNGSGGMLFVRTLLPAQRRITLIGGAGHEYEDPYGSNDTADSRVVDAQYSGTYRIEITPAVRAMSDVFLNVIEAADAGTAEMTPSKLLTGTGAVAARVGDNIVAFSQTEALIVNGEIVIDQVGNYSVLLCDLTPRTAYMIGTTPVTSSTAGTIQVNVSVAAAGARLTYRSAGARSDTAFTPLVSLRVLP